MTTGSHTVSRIVLPLTIAALPLVLLFTSLRTLQEMNDQRAIYLRHRVSLLAARLERLPTGASDELVQETLSEDDSSLVGLEVISHGGRSDNSALDPLWKGRELFRTALLRDPGVTVFRAYIPFHSAEGLRIARIDLDAGVADFLVVHARHNVIVASLGGLVLVGLSVYAIWSMRRAARLQVRQLEMEHLAHIGKMSALLAHEIRNPLGTIKGFVQLARERADRTTGELLAPVVLQAERLENLVRDLLAYGRPPVPAPKLAEWREVAEPLAAHGRHLIGDRPVALEISGRPVAWTTDPALLEQALLNLLRNAIEAIPGAGEVRVELETGADEVVIVVSDTGVGLTEDAQSRLFEPFFTTKASGTGLGLAITRALVASLGGELELRRHDGGGTEATVRFQTHSAPSAARMESS